MTVQDASNILFDWFGTNDSFVMERDFVNAMGKAGKTNFENSEVDKVALELALEGLVTSNMVGTKKKETTLGSGKAKATRVGT